MGKCTSFVAILYYLPSTPLVSLVSAARETTTPLAFAWLFCIVLAFLLTFFSVHMRCDVTGCLRELVSGEVGGGGVHKKVLCGEAPRRTPLTFIYNF